MNYEDFLCCVKSAVQEEMGEEVQIQLHQVTKNNGVILDGLSMVEETEDIAPTVYLNDFYKGFQEGVSVLEIANEICALYQKNRLLKPLDTSFYASFERIQPFVACKVINREKNKELLKKVPNISYLDLAIVFYCYLTNEVIGKGTILIYLDHMKLWGITKEELYAAARRNTLQLFPSRFYSMEQMMGEMMGDTEYKQMEEPEIPMYILTNSEKNLGAAAILFDSVLEDVGQKIQDDFYILPSSIHECIIIPKNIKTTREELCEIVREINETQVQEEEVLSDEVYFYNRMKHQLCI